MTPQEILFRLGVAAGLGLLLGYERELHGRSAGLRTQTIVAIASCLLMVLSLEMQSLHHLLNSNSVVRLDPSRIASYAVAGIGFLGAGAIIHGRGSIQGLTTAACLWASNAVGLTVGAGFIIPAAMATGIFLVVLILLHPLTARISRDTYLRVYLYFNTCEDQMSTIQEALEAHQLKVLHTGFDCRFESNESYYEVAIRLKSTQDWSAIIGSLRQIKGLTGLKWTEGYVP